MSQIFDDADDIELAEHLSRRSVLTATFGGAAALALGGMTGDLAQAKPSPAFEHWVARFRPYALKRGVSAATYDRVMRSVSPDMSVFEALHKQPEFTEKLWQYVNRRCSDWRVITGKERAHEYAKLLGRIERDYGVNRYIMLALWGMESSFGDVVTNLKYMRPVIPALAALGLARPAPPPLLGSGARARADHRRARLGQAIADDRLLGRRHGPHPMDARGLVEDGRRLRPRWPCHAVR